MTTVVGVVWLLPGSSRNSAPSQGGRVAGAYGGLAAGTRSATDRTPAGFHATVAAVEGEVALVVALVLTGRVADGVLLAGGAGVVAGSAGVVTGSARVLTGSGAGAAHAAAVSSSNPPARATTFRISPTSAA